MVDLTKLVRAISAPDRAICRHCGRIKEFHGKMAFTCPPMSGRPHGRMFEEMDNEPTEEELADIRFLDVP